MEIETEQAKRIIDEVSDKYGSADVEEALDKLLRIIENQSYKIGSLQQIILNVNRIATGARIDEEEKAERLWNS